MIYTFGRDEIEKGIDVAEPYVLISISTPPRPGYLPTRAQEADFDESSAFLPKDEFRLASLRLRFDDLEAWPQGMTDRQRAYVAMYSPEQAAQVAAFVRGWQVNFVIHCDAGISRSQGMANAIGDHLDVPVKHYRQGFPNSLVYGLTWQALRPGEGGRLRKAPEWLRPDPDRGTWPTLAPRLPAVKPKPRDLDPYRINFQD